MVIQSKNKRDKEKLYWRKNPAVIISLRSLSKRFSRMANTTFPQYVDDVPEGEYDESFERQQRVNERRRLTTSLDLYLVVAVVVLVAIPLILVLRTPLFFVALLRRLFFLKGSSPQACPCTLILLAASLH